MRRVRVVPSPTAEFGGAELDVDIPVRRESDGNTVQVYHIPADEAFKALAEVNPRAAEKYRKMWSSLAQVVVEIPVDECETVVQQEVNEVFAERAAQRLYGRIKLGPPVESGAKFSLRDLGVDSDAFGIGAYHRILDRVIEKMKSLDPEGHYSPEYHSSSIRVYYNVLVLNANKEL